MPFRSIVANPEDIARMTGALEDAWAEIQRRKPIPVLSVAAERERLGYIVASVWQQDPYCDLVTRAVEHFLATTVAPAALAELTKPGDL